MEESPRLRFAKRELSKALLALEAVDESDFDLAMRVIELEDRLKDSQELAARWRRSFDGLKLIVAASGDEKLKQIEQGMRRWVAES